MKIKLSDHFTYKRIIRFALPSICMMIFTSIYGVVDGLFVSNFVGKTAFSAVNFIIPFLMMLAAFGFLFGAGGSAIISQTMGEGNTERANGLFSFFVIVNFVFGVVFAVLGIAFLPQIAHLLGATGELLETSVHYGRVILIALPAFVTQNAFQAFFVTAEKPTLGLIVTVGAGVTNMVMDAILIAVLQLGVVGAALATALSQVVGGVVPLIYFLCPNKSLLRIRKPLFDLKALLKTMTNGSSELLNNIAMSVASMLFNLQLLRYAGENGVAAYGVLMYLGFVFVAIFIGYSVGMAPVVGYHYGAKNYPELKGLLKRSCVIIGAFSLFMVLVSELLAGPISMVFVGYDKELYEITKHAFFIYGFSFLASGYGIYGSSFFTALGDGLTSAVISFMRTLVFQTLFVFTLPLVMGLEGIWLSIVLAEVLSTLLTAICIVLKRKRYHYL